ncbi:unannotated protein [freshwater metagenome]|uniref:Unannotated protein n=1 Tax=freshwater metagenome TaxID=449393 RepID=A0A6J7FTC8_9ZZZZ|nr:hypothetical protein [Actinomycetota bacterium]
MTLTDTRSTSDNPAATAGPPVPTALERVMGTGEHQAIGRTFILSSLLLMAVSAGALAVGGLTALGSSGPLDVSDPLWSSALVAMVLIGALPLLLGLAICLVPMQVGSEAIAFPRATALSLWAWLISAAIFIISVPLDGGVGGAKLEAARLGMLSMGAMMIALSLGAACVATTVLSHRPVGMSLSKVPFFSWSMLVAAPIWILTFGSTVAHVFLGQISQANAAGLALRYSAGVSWFLRAPAVYMLAIPVLGICCDLVAQACGRRFARYGTVQALIAMYGVFSFGAWSQTAGGRENILWIAFVALAAVPVLGLLGLVADTLRHQKPVVTPGLIGVLFAFLLLLGGLLSGVLEALNTTGSSTLFSFEAAGLGWAQGVFLLSAAFVGGLAALSAWSRVVLRASAPNAIAGASMAAGLIGGGLLGTVFLIQGITGFGLNRSFFNVWVAAAASLLALGALLGLMMALVTSRGNSAEPAESGSAGLTLEWAATELSAQDHAVLLRTIVASPYPLLDFRSTGEAVEEDN